MFSEADCWVPREGIQDAEMSVQYMASWRNCYLFSMWNVATWSENLQTGDLGFDSMVLGTVYTWSLVATLQQRL